MQDFINPSPLLTMKITFYELKQYVKEYEDLIDEIPILYDLLRYNNNIITCSNPIVRPKLDIKKVWRKFELAMNRFQYLNQVMQIHRPMFNIIMQRNGKIPTLKNFFCIANFYEACRVQLYEELVELPNGFRIPKDMYDLYYKDSPRKFEYLYLGI